MKFQSLILLCLFSLVVSCTSFPALMTPPSATPSGSRSIVLNGELVSEEEAGGFTSWYGQDFIDGGPVLVEVGFFGDPDFEGLGYILYDGGYTGELTFYGRSGLDLRWDWGPNGTDYSFIIEPDGTGLYYDFSSIGKGKSTKASAVYKCSQW